MKTFQTENLTGQMLAFAVKLASNESLSDTLGRVQEIGSAEAWDIMDRENISILYRPEQDIESRFWACMGDDPSDEETEGMFGPDRKTAALRCYVAEKLGFEIEIPQTDEEFESPRQKLKP